MGKKTFFNPEKDIIFRLFHAWEKIESSDRKPLSDGFISVFLTCLMVENFCSFNPKLIPILAVWNVSCGIHQFRTILHDWWIPAVNDQCGEPFFLSVSEHAKSK